MARTSDRFSMELSALLDDDSDGHRLAEYLLKKRGGTTRPKRVFADYKPTRFSIDVRTEKIDSPIEKQNASPTTSDGMQRDVAKMQQLSNEAEPLQEKNKAVSTPILFAGSPALQPVAVPAPKCTSPSERLSVRRSGGAMPSSDRLRRFSLKRLSTLSVGRKLLKEFDSTVTDSDFLPPICSTPMTHPPNISPAEQNPCNSKKLEENAAKTIESDSQSTISSLTTTGTHNNTERMLNSLRQHDEALHHMLEHDLEDITNKQVHEKENLFRNAVHTPPTPKPQQTAPQQTAPQPPVPQPSVPQPPVPQPPVPQPSAPHKRPNQDSRPATPVSNQRSRPTTPVGNQRSRPTTPVGNQRSRPTTPVGNQRSRPTTPVENQRSRPTTPVSRQYSRPTTPVPRQYSRPTTPVPRQYSRPRTPVPTTPSRTYTVEKGSQPGQVVLTPAKSPSAPEQQQQPTSTVEDRELDLPSSPVEQAVYNLHRVNLVTSDNLMGVSPLPVKPLFSSPKQLRVTQCKSRQPATTLKASSIKKSRIPLMTPAVKLNHKTAHLEVPNTPANAIPEVQVESDVEIPETQDLPTETQKLLETLQKSQSMTPMIVIPIHQTINHTPTQSHETTNAGKKNATKMPTVCSYNNETTTTPLNIEVDTSTRQRTSKKADAISAECPESPTSEIICNEDDLRLSYILTDDDDEQVTAVPRNNRRPVSNDDCQLECSNAPLNLASQPVPTRSRRLRKRSTTRRTQQQQQTKLSPLLSTETESEVGPPPAHPLITRRTSGRQHRKIPLNAAPNTPINGELFAVEMKTHLARLNNREILDLRKRNSLGKVFAISGRRKSSLSRKASLNAKQALDQQLQLEEEIQLEILKRTLNGQGDDLRQHSPVSVSILLAEEEAERINKLPTVENEQIYELPNEENELVHTIPPAPADFRDITTRQSLAKTMFWLDQENFEKSSLLDDNSCDQVKFISENISIKSTRSKAARRSGRRSKKPLPEVLEKYLKVSNRTTKKRTSANRTRRSLYSLDTEISNSENSSLDKTESPSKTPVSTPVEQQQQLETTFILSTSKRHTDQPLPPPHSFADELVHTTAAESMTVSTVAGTSIANDMDNNVFKKPGLPVPRKKQTKKTSRAKVSKKTTDDQQITDVTTPQKHNNNNNNDVLQSNSAEPHNESSSLRRSKRGPKPFKNYWSFRSTDTMPLYDVAILERRREESKKLRESRLQNSKASITSENSTMPTASSTIKSNTNSTKKRARPKNVLGDTDPSRLSSSVSSAPRQKRLAIIQETESQSVIDTEQARQEKNLGDNMFDRLDEVNISISQTHKVSRTPQRNKSPALTKNDDAEKATKKKTTSKATKNASKVKKPPPQSKKSTAKSASSTKKKKTEETVINPEPEENRSQSKKTTAKSASSTKKKKTEETVINPEPEENRPQSKKSTSKLASSTKKKKTEETVINPEPQENLREFAATSEPVQHVAVHSSTAAHINAIFDQLKSGRTVDITHPINPSNLTKCLPSTSKKLCRVRLARVKSCVESKSSKTRSSSSNISRVNLASSQVMNEEDYGSNAPAWLRDISNVGSKILKDTDEEKEVFEEMVCSQPGNLVLSDIEGLDYVYYENDKDIPFGYIRFQPNQAKRTRKARHYNLRFFVMSGKFKICTNKDKAHFSEGSVVTILKGSCYSITNLTDKLAILMVFKTQEN